MVKNRKGFNWKARDQSTAVADGGTKQTEVEVDLQDERTDNYDGSNVFILPANKPGTKHKDEHVKKTKKLTKKERKKFEKILEQKQKKAKRAEVMDILAQHQVSTDEMNQFTSIAEMQTGKTKRKIDKIIDGDVNVNTISGSNKKWKNVPSESETDGEESIHTSDMSSDEELPGKTNMEGEKGENSVICDQKMLDKIDKYNDELIYNDKGIIGTSSSDSGEEIVTLDSHIVRSTCCKWTVTEKKKKVKRTKMKNNKKDYSKIDDDKLVQVKTVTPVTNNVNNEKNVSESKAKIVKSEKTQSAEANNENGDKVTAIEEVKKAVFIPVTRDAKIQEGRLKLPILGEEQIVMENINEHPVVIICGETGSGKTTQVPQFLYEAGYAHGGGIIGVTEPRRVAAISMSKRVTKELALTSRHVSYQIRYEGNVTPDTKIKFMTDGVLLKEVQKDFLLMKYSVIIIDEAHERSMYTDILIGLLSRIVPLRHKKGNPLKLVIMSATLRVEDFTENLRLFRITPPVVKVDARQFPVTIHYNKRTPLEGYLNETYRKTCKIHQQLPEGGILIFVTGQQEVHTLCKKLKQSFPLTENTEKYVSQKHTSRSQRRQENEGEKKPVELPKISLDNYSVSPLDEEAEMEAGDLDLSDDDLDLGNHGDDEEDISMTTVDGVRQAGGSTQPLYVLPLYSLLATDKQARVFEPPPDGCRLCVVATNVAETSLTIPHIKYVVDTGKMKTKFYDKVTGVSTFKITWTSKAGANQRAGRAGRMGPGHCYRLYSSAVFNDEFEQFSSAEITRRPVDDLVLQMKDMNIEKVINFPYPTPPDMEQIMAAEHLLISLGAVTQPSTPKSFKDSKKVVETSITELGKAMACFPVSPRYAKMLVLGHQHDLLPYVVVMVAALSVQELFTEIYSSSQDNTQEEVMKKKLLHMKDVKRKWAGTGHSLLLGDLMVMIKAVGSCEYEGGRPDFCDSHGIRYKAMMEVRKLRMQLTNAVNTVIPEASICVDPKMSPPDDLQAKLLRQIVLAGMGDHVAKRCPDLPALDPNAKKMKHAYQCADLEDPVFIHPTSILYRQAPDYVVFQYIQETSKLYMKGIVAIEPEWLPVFASSHVTLSKPMEKPPPDFDEVKGQVTCHMTGSFGNCAWPVPAVSLVYPTGIEKMKWFARFLMEGKVVKKLEKFIPDMLSAPATMVKTWAKLQPRTETLLTALISERVDSRDLLVKVWKKQPDYLLPAIKEWIPQSRHEELTSMWPPIDVL